MWHKAKVVGRQDETGAIEAGQHYFTIDVIDSNLSKKWFVFTRWHPIIVSDLMVNSSSRSQLHHPAVIDPRKVSESITTTGGGGGKAVRPVCRMAPWNGRASGELSFLSLRSEKLLKQILSVTETLQEAMNSGGGMTEGETSNGEIPGGAAPEGEAGHESLTLAALAPVAGAVGKVVQKAGAAVATKVAKLIADEDGAYQKRLIGLFDRFQPETGYFVLLNDGNVQPQSVEIRFRGQGDASPEVTVDGKSASKRDYVVIRVTREDTHDDIESIPNVAEAWKMLQTVMISGGDTNEAFRAFRTSIMLAPQLVDPDRDRVLNMVQGLLRRVAGEQVNATPGVGQGHESFSDRQQNVGRVVGFAIPSLQDAWMAGSFEAVIQSRPRPVGVATAGFSAAAAAAAGVAPAPAPAPTPASAARAATDPGMSTRPEPSVQPFEDALKFAFKWEGEYSDIPGDTGGKTKYGITEAVFNAWRDLQVNPPKTLRDLTKEDAKAIYWSNYWLLARCGQFQRPLDLVMFDAAVNHGPGGAARILQRALNALQDNMKLPGSLKLSVDGGIGAKTLAEADRYKPIDLCMAYLEQRRATYHAIVANSKKPESKVPDQGKFLKGWLNRVDDLQQRIQGLESVITQPEENNAFAGYAE